MGHKQTVPTEAPLCRPEPALAADALWRPTVLVWVMLGGLQPRSLEEIRLHNTDGSHSIGTGILSDGWRQNASQIYYNTESGWGG